MKPADSDSSPYSVRRRLGDRSPRKALGQHFLNNPSICARIVDLARITPTDHVIEIGPGLGALTAILAERSQRLTLIELDRDLAADLRQRFADNPRVTLVEADVLKAPLEQIVGQQSCLAIGNLPYNVATAVLERLLDLPSIHRIVAMVQLEVAERLAASPGTRKYGALSVFTQLAARVTLAFKVRAGAFVPPPKVDSAVVVMERHANPPVELTDPGIFDRLVRTTFGQRRKQLGNSMRPLSDDPDGILREIGIDPARRPETLSLAEFAAISNRLARSGNA